MATTTRKPTNLSLDAAAVTRGEQFSRLHGTSLSRLVEDFLRALPVSRSGAVAEEEPLRSPVVRRLRGVAHAPRAGLEDYRKHLQHKYGGR